MPLDHPTAGADTRLSPIRATGILTLSITILLCLPSLVGGTAFVFNLLLYQDIEQWRQTSSALIALGILVGGPLVALAAIVGGVTTLCRRVPFRMKCAHLFVVSLATIATLSLLFRFGCLFG